MKKSEQNIGILLVAISAASFGLMPIFAKMAYASGTSTYTLLFLRFLMATLFMFALIFVRRLPLPSGKDIRALFLLGAIGDVGQSLCFFTALHYASASLASLLVYIYPALVMVGAVLFLHERMTRAKLVSLALALSGAFVIVGGEYEASPLGVILSLLAALFYTVYVLVNSKIAKPGMGIQASAFILLGATTVYGVITLFVGFTPPTDKSGIMAILLITAISTILAFWSFLSGLEKTGASTAALVSILEPVVTVIAAVLVLSEDLTLNILLGGILVLGALVITTSSKKEAKG